MSLVNIGNFCPALPDAPGLTANASFQGSTINATGARIAWMGRVRIPDKTSRNIRRVHFLTGTMVTAGGSAYTVSLQDVDLANGSPMRADGTQDQTVALTAPASNTWVRTNALSADRTVANGDLLAAVVEFDGSGRLSSDSMQVNNLFWSEIGNACLYPTVSTRSGAGTWTSVLTAIPNVMFEDSNGDFFTFDHVPFVASNLASVQFKSNTAGADEYGIQFQVPFSCKVDGAWALVFPNANTADFDVVLYSGTTALASVSVDANAVSAANSLRYLWVNFASDVTLTINTNYVLAIKPTQTTSTVELSYFDVSSAGHMAVAPGGVNCFQAKRIDLGSWDVSVTTRRPLMGVRISALDSGGGGSVAGPVLSSPVIRGVA